MLYEVITGGVAGGSIGRYMDNQEAAMRQQLAGVEAANIQRNANLLAITFKSDFMFDVNSSNLKAGSYDEITRITSYNVCYTKLLRNCLSITNSP